MNMLFSFCDRTAAVIECVSFFYLVFAFAEFSVNCIDAAKTTSQNLERVSVLADLKIMDTIAKPTLSEAVEALPLQCLATVPIDADWDVAAAVPANDKKWRSWKTQQLREQCKSSGIKWRSAHGNGKHLTVAEMQWQVDLVALF